VQRTGYAEWCKAIRSPVRDGRKQWEHVFFLETLRQHGMIHEGAHGVGFGCRREPSVAILAELGCSILATDLSPEAVAGKGWTETGQHASSFETLNEHGICHPETFRRRVFLRYVDMNEIPDDIVDYDFTWSSCALEHLGSLRHGLDFIEASIRCLRPGGVAVHTTEFNLSSTDRTLEDVNCVVYRRKDIEEFAVECATEGIEVAPPQPASGDRTAGRARRYRAIWHRSLPAPPARLRRTTAREVIVVSRLRPHHVLEALLAHIEKHLVDFPRLRPA
jgi:SAM-dependent methyltransferase